MFIVSINTWKCEGNYQQRVSTFARHLSVLDPDVVMLQEVFAAPEVDADTSGTVSRALPEHRCIPATARNKLRWFGDREVASISGLATLIRGSSSHNKIVQLPDVQDDRGRVAHVIDANVNGIQLQLVNIHLSHIRGADRLRCHQLACVIKELWQGPVVIAGDFNSRPDSKTIDLLRAEFDEVLVSKVPTGPGGGVIDYFAYRGLALNAVQLEPLFDGNELPIVSDHIGLGLHLDICKDS